MMAEDIALFCVRGGEVGSRVRKIGERDAGAGTGLALAGLQHQQQQQPSSHQKPHQPNHHRPGSDDNTAVNSSGAQTHINCSSSVRGGSLGRMDPLDEFPVGMKVLVVDDDPVCLTILEHLLRKCSYRVTTCGRAADALSLLREDISKFDLVISDVYMPDMDGFKLLELVGLEMDLPVIMMSGNGETSAVMKGITHGACDYLLKPVRIEELRNIWQHVVRKKRQEIKDIGHSKSLDEGTERQKRGGVEDTDYTSSATDTDGRCTKRRKESKEEEEDNEQETDDPSTMKKPRVVWSVELHQQFVSAVNQLGIDKAVPKRILELMGVHGLTRENVASHLQKYRLYLKRISGVTTQQNNMNVHFGGSDSFLMSPEGMGLNLAGGQLTPQALAQLNFLGRMNSSNGIGLSNGLDPMLGQFLLQDLPGPHINGMMKSSSSLLPSLPTGLHLDQLPDTAHHLPLINELDNIPSNSKAFPQMNGNCDLGVGSFGGTSGNLSNPSGDALVMHILHSRAPQQGGGSPANLSQPRGGLGPLHLLANDINFGPVSPSPTILGNIGPGIGLPAINGSGGRDSSPSIGAGTSLSSALGASVHHAPLADEQPLLGNSAAGTFSMAVSVQSPKLGGGPGHSLVHEVLNQQQSMWAYNPPNHLSQAQHRFSQGTSPAWLGYTENMVGDIGPALSSGISPQFSTQVQNYGGGLLDSELSGKFTPGWRNEGNPKVPHL